MTDADVIRNMIPSYCHSVDAHAVEDWADLFTDGASLYRHDQRLAHGREALESWFSQHIIPAGNHLTMNVQVDVDGDRAQSTCNFIFVGADLTIQAIGRYEGDFVRGAHGWKIQEWRYFPRAAITAPA